MTCIIHTFHRSTVIHRNLTSISTSLKKVISDAIRSILAVVRAFATRDGALCSKNSKIDTYQGEKPVPKNTSYCLRPRLWLLRLVNLVQACANQKSKRMRYLFDHSLELPKAIATEIRNFTGHSCLLTVPVLATGMEKKKTLSFKYIYPLKIQDNSETCACLYTYYN